MSSPEQPNNPLHGTTLQQVLERLLDRHDWDGLARRVNINCFKNDPSIKSSLKFLRRTQWARDEVERLYLETFYPDAEKARNAPEAREAQIWNAALSRRKS